jgi:hypothetical protein
LRGVFDGKKHTAEQIVNLPRQVEVGVANDKTLPQACKEAEIVEQRYSLLARLGVRGLSGASLASTPETAQTSCEFQRR